MATWHKRTEPAMLEILFFSQSQWLWSQIYMDTTCQLPEAKGFAGADSYHQCLPRFKCLIALKMSLSNHYCIVGFYQVGRLQLAPQECQICLRNRLVSFEGAIMAIPGSNCRNISWKPMRLQSCSLLEYAFEKVCAQDRQTWGCVFFSLTESTATFIQRPSISFDAWDKQHVVLVRWYSITLPPVPQLVNHLHTKPPPCEISVGMRWNLLWDALPRTLGLFEYLHVRVCPIRLSIDLLSLDHQELGLDQTRVERCVRACLASGQQPGMNFDRCDCSRMS